MFLEYYGLKEQPFGVSPDPRFLFPSPTHREAFASLHYGVTSGRGFLALIAQPGMGKTTLLVQLLQRLRQCAKTVFLFQTQSSPQDLLRNLLADLGISSEGSDLVRIHSKLNEILLSEAHAGRRFVLVIDEAQNLDFEVLEVVRMLSNFETPQQKLMQIILAGQPPLAAKLAAPGMVQLRQRLAIVARLKSLSPEETQSYIEHRLRVAGAAGADLFTPGALQMIARHSVGIPRNINMLCFNALSLGCAIRKIRVDEEVLREVLQDLDLQSTSPEPRLPSFSSLATPSTRAPAKPKTKRLLQKWAPRLVFGCAIAGFAALLPSGNHGTARRAPSQGERNPPVRVLQPAGTTNQPKAIHRAVSGSAQQHDVTARAPRSRGAEAVGGTVGKSGREDGMSQPRTILKSNSLAKGASETAELPLEQ
jgi:general secretion pathway protein A